MDLIRWFDGKHETVHATDQLSAEYAPALSYADVASGLLAVAVSREPRHHVLWFRPEIVKTVKWAGDPTKPLNVEAPGVGAPGEAAESLRVLLLETTLKGVVAGRSEFH
jgi:light-regulated signal transduction histidine kinase (bacteriophytochrome)